MLKVKDKQSDHVTFELVVNATGELVNDATGECFSFEDAPEDIKGYTSRYKEDSGDKFDLNIMKPGVDVLMKCYRMRDNNGRLMTPEIGQLIYNSCFAPYDIEGFMAVDNSITCMQKVAVYDSIGTYFMDTFGTIIKKK